MNKTVAGAALIGGLGLSALAGAPASALSFPLFESCEAAAGAGVYNIPVEDPRYTAALDTDSDGIACENSAYAYVPLPPVGDVPIGEVPQIEQVPVGGADTGVAVPAEQDVSATVAVGAAALAAVAGGAVLVRRRSARA
jgi:hypothetical protein